MAPLYNIDLMTKLGPEAPKRLETLLKSAARLLWDRGAVISDMRSWGQLELAYRIRRDSVNHYHAHFLSMQIHCSPPVLHELEESLRLDDHVLRYLTLKQRQLPPLEEGVHKWYLPKKKDEPLDLQADAIEAAKVEYRNLVMQRVFEGRTKQEIIGDAMTAHKFQLADKHANYAQAQHLSDKERAAAFSVERLRTLAGGQSVDNSTLDTPTNDFPGADAEPPDDRR